MDKKKIDRIGETKLMNCGIEATIIEYNTANDILVEFKEYKEIVHTTYGNFKIGNVRLFYKSDIYEIGFNGLKGDEKTIEYNYWRDMIKRCYDIKEIKKHPTYEGCTVCNEWHDFQNFKKWFNKNYYIIKEESMQLDKDILHKGNKLYSPENCCFVPKRINCLFVKKDANRGDYPIGVSLRPNNGKFWARCSVIENNKYKRISLGCYNTPEDAFYLGYKPFKESYIKQVAENYKGAIPNKLYKAMINYIVEITD